MASNFQKRAKQLENVLREETAFVAMTLASLTELLCQK